MREASFRLRFLLHSLQFVVCFYPGPQSVEKGVVVRLIVAFTADGKTLFIELLRS
jgi:hypothetical protein